MLHCFLLSAAVPLLRDGALALDSLLLLCSAISDRIHREGNEASSGNSLCIHSRSLGGSCHDIRFDTFVPLKHNTVLLLYYTFCPKLKFGTKVV